MTLARTDETRRKFTERTCYRCFSRVGKSGVCECGCVATFRGEHPRIQPWEPLETRTLDGNERRGKYDE